MCPYEDAISERLALGPAWTPWSASDSPEDRAYRTEQDDHVPEAGHPCGICTSCIEAQRADLLHGSPSDLDFP